jgi:ABC-2 type transport system permease protein
MSAVLRGLSDVLPMSYAVEAMQQLTLGAGWSGTVVRDVAVILAFTLCALLGGAMTLRRRSA